MSQKTFIHNDEERDCGCPESPETYKSNAKTINLAIEGGGAHGAYAWGVIDGLLEDGRIKIEGISATSAGSTSAAPTPSSTDQPNASVATDHDTAVSADPVP